MGYKRKNMEGITLVEVVVVVGILLSLIFGGVAYIKRQMVVIQMVHARDTGVGIYKTINSSEDDPVFYPATAGAHLRADANQTFETSTEYFKFLIKEEVIETDFSLFGIAPYHPTNKSSDPTAFFPSNNAWCVVERVFDTAVSQSTPFLMTRNLEIERLNEDLGNSPLTFWKDIVVISRDGQGKIIKGNQLRAMTDGFGGVTNRVLRP